MARNAAKYLSPTADLTSKIMLRDIKPSVKHTRFVDRTTDISAFFRAIRTLHISLERIMRRVSTITTASFLLLACGAFANPVHSWNLSRDMMTSFAENRIGDENVWTAMYDSGGVSHNPNNYLPLTTFHSQYDGYPLDALVSEEPWLVVALPKSRFSIPRSSISIAAGLPIMHPGQANASIIRWKSPIRGSINISGRISDANTNGGDGVAYYIDKGSTRLLSSSFRNGSKGHTIKLKNIKVEVDTEIFFIVDPKGDYSCDQTALDILIYGDSGARVMKSTPGN